MKYIKQFVIILFISFIGEILNYLIPLPIPASIYGILLLFLTLEFKIIMPSAVREVGAFLIAITPVMFIPAGVGLMESWGILKPSILAYAAITFLTTILVMAVSGLATQAMIKFGKKKEGEEE